MNFQRQMDKLKAIARDLGVEPVGDRRKRETWEQAIERHHFFTPVLAPERAQLQSQISEWRISSAFAEIRNAPLPSYRFSKGDRVRVNSSHRRFGGIFGHVCTHSLYVVIEFDNFVPRPGLPPAKFGIFKPDDVALVLFQESSDISDIPPGVEIEALALLESSDTLAASPGVEIEALALLESSDTLAASPGVESEPVVLSDRFLAAYAPPQVQIHYQADADGQLSLLDFQVESVEEAPDPDDFESLDAFYEAIALWDSEHYQPLEISLDSFCEWAPCPDDWYEPAGENSPGVDRVQALLESFNTSKFFIPVFDCDRPDEPPTAGVGACLPKPKPPSFPPTQPKPPNSPQTHSGTAGYSGRSPPGGNAVF